MNNGRYARNCPIKKLPTQVVFLTETGHPPTIETMEFYLSLFIVDNPRLSCYQAVSAGPTLNRSENLIKAIHNNPKTLQIAVLYDKDQCQLLDQSLFQTFVSAANQNPTKTSWQIAMSLLSSKV